MIITSVKIDTHETKCIIIISTCVIMSYKFHRSLGNAHSYDQKYFDALGSYMQQTILHAVC